MAADAIKQGWYRTGSRVAHRYRKGHLGSLCGRWGYYDAQDRQTDGMKRCKACKAAETRSARESAPTQEAQ